MKATTPSTLPAFFTDSDGNQTIALVPNGKLLLIALALIGERVAQAEWHTWAQVLVLVAITLWASDEFFYGISGFRRLLGLSFLVYVTYELLKISFWL